MLDIAPFCRSKVKTLPNDQYGQKILFDSLYGIVQYFGAIYAGHYVAYIIVHPQLAKDNPR